MIYILGDNVAKNGYNWLFYSCYRSIVNRLLMQRGIFMQKFLQFANSNNRLIDDTLWDCVISIMENFQQIFVCIFRNTTKL